MEVVAAAPEGAGGAQPSQPFARRDVREWSRLDSVTGAREHARVESDRWSTRSAAGARSYGKVVDSRVCNAADGRAQATSRRQLEVFRQQSPGGSFQVVRTSTTSVSSSSSGGPASARLQLGFENLQLPLNPLDVGPQRTRASVGRSGSIGSRRPPSRQPRAALSAAPAAPAAAGAAARDAAASPVGDDADAEVDSLTAQVSRICRQLHAEAQRAAFGPSASRLLSDAAAPAGDSAAEESDGGVVIQELSDSDSAAAPAAPTAAPAAAPAADHPPAVRLRSSSIEDLQDASQATGQPAWTRASQVRRSLQFPTRASQERESSPTQRPLPGRLFPEDSKLFEGGKLKGLEALENVFRRGANIAESVNKSMTHDREDVDASNSDSLANHLRNESMNRSSSHSFNMDSFMRRPSTNGTSSANSTKRHSFVTVESLKEVRGRLRPLNSPSDEEPKQLQQQKSILKPTKDDEDHDDGIVTDDHVKHPEAETTSDVPTSKVKCFILGMEGIANNRNGTRKPVLGTGSLESRTSSRSNSSSNNRSEEWYNRRKSYGFEQVHAQDSNDHVRPTRLWEKNRVESSTDSGICRSSEAVSGPPWNRTSPSKIEEGKAFDNRKTDNVLKISHNIQIKKQEEKDKISEDNENERNAFQRGRRTIVTLGNEYNKNSSTYKPADDGSIVVHNSIIKDTSSISLNGYRGAAEDEHRFKPLAGPGSVKDLRRQSEPVTITIPIVSEDADKETSNVESKRLFFRQLSEGTSLSIESGDRKSVFANGSTLRDSFKRGTWNGGDDWNNASKAMDNEMKRHSIAVDESKYVREGIKRFSNLHDTKSKELANVSTSELVKRFAAMHAGKKEESVFSNKDKFSQNSAPSGFNVSFVQNGESFGIDDQNKKHKKVEFCKTEVHFAAESGRVNIVETDEKPPPSNPIRRRRRVSAGSITQSVTPDPTKSTLPEIRFGDSPYEKQLLGGNETAESTDVAPTPVLVKPEPTRPTVVALAKYQNDGEKEDQIYTQANATIATTIHQESTLQSYEGTTADHLSVSSQFNEPMPRSILKNNRKPKPFILGENNEAVVETSDSQDDKWGVRLRPVQSNTDTGAAMWRSTVTLRSTAFDCSQQSTDRKEEPLPASIHGNGESELQKMIKALRPAGQRRSNSETDSTSSPQCSPVAAKKSIGEPTNNSVQVTISSPPTESVFNGWTVADRIKHVEDLKHSSETKGYSTRINFGSGEATVVESGSSDDQQNASQKHAGGAPLFQKSDKSKPMWLRREEKKQELQDAEHEEPHHQVSVASAMLPSYDPNRLRRVETLVSTRSGQPKITSIALHYEGDQADDRQPKSSSSFSASTYSQQQQSSAWKNLESSNAYAPRNEEKPSVGFSYYKPTESAKQPLADDRRDRTYKIDKHKERLHIEETVTREKSSPNREPLFSSDRRTSPPKEGHLRSPSPPTSRRPTTFSSPNKTSSPSGRYDSDRERSMSPASKPQPKATTYFGEVRSSAFGSPYRQDSPRKSEGSRSYERKSEERTHRRSTMESTGGGHQRALLDASSNGHQRALVENVNNGHQRSRVGVSTREEHRRYSYESAARSRSASRGRSLSPAKAIDSRKQPPAPPQPPQEETGYDSPIYENIDEVLEESVSTRRAETDSAILEELTRAADQILQAVNGYTDEDSRASSDDDDASKRYRRGRRGGRPAERLCTIAEAPPARRARDAAAASSGAATRASAAAGAGSSAGAAARRAQRPSQTRLGRNSSTSSVESFTREVRRSAAAAAHAQTHARALLRRERQAVEETRRKVTAAQAAAGPGAGASRASSRAARLLQRASSRELLLKAHASSSEDVMSGAEAADAAAALAARKARAPRRARAATAASAAKSSSLTSASSGGRRASPSRPAPPAAPAAAVAAAAGAARPRRREADVPKGKERSHGARPEESRRRSASRRDEAEAARARLSAGGRPAGYGSGAGGLSGGMGGGGRERGSSDRRATAALASSSAAAATAARAAAAAAAAAGPPTHAVAKKPSSSRSESLSHSKISK